MDSPRFIFYVRLLTLVVCSLWASTGMALTNAHYAMDTEELTMSPSGKRVAVLKTVKGEKIVNIIDIEQKKSLGGFNISELNPRQMYFISEHRLILVAWEEMRLHWYRGTHDISTAFAYDLRTNQVEQLLKPGEVIYTGQSGLGHIVGLSKDRQFAYMPAFTQKASRNSPGPVVYSLLKVDLSGKRKPKIVSRGRSDVIDYFVNHSGKLLARERYNHRSGVYSIEARRGNKWHEIYSHDTELRDFSISGVSPDAKSLVLVKVDENTGFDSCYTMDLATGKISEKLFSRDDKDIARIIDDINRVIYGVVYAGFTPEYQFFDKDLTRRLAAIQKKFGPQSVSLVDWGSSFEQLLVYVEGGQSPGDYYGFDKKNQGRFLMTARKEIKPENIHPMVQIQYKAEDGLVIPTILTFPRSKVSKPANLPTVLLPHGGPESHDTLGFDWLAQAFANQGFLVVQPQFRGSSGFGAKHLLAGRGEWGKKMQSDLRDGVNQLVKEGLIDKKRLCIVGWSYGGYAALAGAVFDHDLYACAVSINGVTDLTRMLKQEKREQHRGFDVYSYWEYVIGNGEVDETFTDSISPVNFAGQVNAPVLLVWSDEDEVVPPKQSKIMWKALKKADKSVERLIIKGEDHSFIDPLNREKTLNGIVEFVKKHTL